MRERFADCRSVHAMSMALTDLRGSPRNREWCGALRAGRPMLDLTSAARQIGRTKSSSSAAGGSASSSLPPDYDAKLLPDDESSPSRNLFEVGRTAPLDVPERRSSSKTPLYCAGHLDGGSLCLAQGSHVIAEEGSTVLADLSLPSAA